MELRKVIVTIKVSITESLSISFPISCALGNQKSAFHKMELLKKLKIFLALTATFFCSSASSLNLDLISLDETLTVLEQKRTQSPRLIADALLEIKKLESEMSLEQQYRYTLLQAHSYTLNGNSNGAFTILNQQLKSAIPEHLRRYKTRTLSLLANSYSHFNQFSDALKVLHELLPLLSEVDDIESEVTGYRLAIELFGEVNMQNEALIYAKILYGHFDRITSPRHKCFVAFNYAESYFGVYSFSSSRWSEIESLYENVYDLCNAANEKMIMAAAALGQSKVLINRQLFEQAKSLAEHALELSSSIPYPHDMAEANLLLAKIEIQSGQQLSGVERLEKALEIGLKLDDSKLLSKIYKPLAELSEGLGESSEALEYLKLYQKHHSKILGETQSKIIAFETTKLDYLEKERQIRYLNKDRELYTAKAALTESQRNNERMMNTLIVGGLVLLGIFAGVMTLQRRKYKQLAQKDALTGIFNRGTAQNIAEVSFIKGLSRGASFSVVMFDLDLFKRINDDFGHGTGDWVLKKVADVISKTSRSGDVFARLGGEEFAIFLPNTSEAIAYTIAEHCRVLLTEIDTKYSGHTFNLSASFGVTSSSEDDLSIDPMLHRADIAMYHSKQQGRNQVTLYQAEIEKSRKGYQKSDFALR